MRTFLLALMVLLLPFTPNAAGSSHGSTIEGEGVIRCEMVAGYNLRTRCDGLADHSVQPESVPAADYERVSILIDWVPVYLEAEMLRVDLFANPDFNQYGNPTCGLIQKKLNCTQVTVQGQSPLSLSLDGHAAAQGDLFAYVSVADTCGRDGNPLSCDLVPYRIAEDQGFSYQWSLHHRA